MSNCFYGILIFVQHDAFSIKVFKRLLRNTAVLAEFVRKGLGVTEVNLIELMIKPNKKGKLGEPWKSREFLCEVKTYWIMTIILFSIYRS